MANSDHAIEQMNETPNKPTPGPWTVHHFLAPDMDRTDAGLYEVEEANRRILERLDDGRTGDREDRTSAWMDVHDEADANARLIAAAPDLLAALKAILNSDGLPEHVHEDNRARAIAAIAKAEGREVEA